MTVVPLVWLEAAVVPLTPLVTVQVVHDVFVTKNCSVSMVTKNLLLPLLATGNEDPEFGVTHIED